MNKWFAGLILLGLLVSLAMFLYLPIIILNIPIYNIINNSHDASRYGITKGDILYYYGVFLTFISTSVLGVFAYRQSVKANELSKYLATLEMNDRKPVIEMDISSEMRAYYRNEDNGFYRENSLVNFVIDQRNGGEANNIAFILSFTNISRVPITELILEHMSITDNNGTIINSQRWMCRSETKNLIHPDESVSVFISVERLCEDLFDDIANRYSKIFVDLRIQAKSANNLITTTNIGVQAKSSKMWQDKRIDYVLSYKKFELE